MQVSLDRLIRAGAIHSMTGEVRRSVGLRGATIAAVSSEPELTGRAASPNSPPWPGPRHVPRPRAHGS